MAEDFDELLLTNSGVARIWLSIASTPGSFSYAKKRAWYALSAHYSVKFFEHGGVHMGSVRTILQTQSTNTEPRRNAP